MAQSKDVARARRQNELVAEYRHTKSQAAFLELLGTVNGLIGMIIRRYARPGLPIDELSAEAVIGFMMALDRHNPEISPFSATVNVYVRKVVDACAHRLGRSTSSAYGRQERAIQIHGARLFRECRDAGLPASVAVDLVAESMGYDPQHVAAAMSRQQHIDWSIDETRHVDEDGERGDWLATGEESAEDAVTSSDRSRVIEELLSELPHEQEIVIRRRILCETKSRYVDIAREIGVGEKKASELERRAMAALRVAMDERGLTMADLI